MNNQSEQFLNSFINHEHRLHQFISDEINLERMRALLHEIGSSVEKCPIVHVAGSKGKGTTCALIAHILAHAGFRVGLYTSPHLVSLHERIRVLTPEKQVLKEGELFPDTISEDELLEVFAEMKPKIDRIHADPTKGKFSYFEILTAAAWVYFEKQNVDVVILEVGLGGRLDATNAVQTDIAVIVNVSLEHTHILGENLEKIAFEKAGIIKSSHQRVVVGNLPEEAMAVVLERCRKFNIQPLVFSRHLTVKNIRLIKRTMLFDMFTSGKYYHNVHCPLIGAHQAHNAVLAAGVIEMLKAHQLRVSEKQVKHGISEADWPGRFQCLGNPPRVILDGAHTVESLQNLVDNVERVFPGKNQIFVFGASKDKNISELVKVLSKEGRKVYLTSSSHPRRYCFTGEENFLRTLKSNYVITQRVEQAWELLPPETTEESLVIFTGSMFVVSDALKIAAIRQLLKETKHESI
ncbi:MAG: bifunctional folylpolyglutamate synthase/dihydrofolate synthase [Candidatus Omnitrophica bacterium]|nr:bifunctional folylpolyglutamate synthase/dihydrofolate synthase [Candidatus Omnitrophota bacterium]